MALEYKTACLNRWLGRCKDCTEDYDPNHHPNNLDCPNYKSITVLYFYVERNSNIDRAQQEKQEQTNLEEALT